MELIVQKYIEKNIFHYSPVFVVTSSKIEKEAGESQIVKDPSRKAFWLDQSTSKRYTDYDVLVKDVIKKVLP